MPDTNQDEVHGPEMDPTFNRTVQARYGLMAFNKNDQYVGRSFALYKEFSQGEVDFFEQIVSSGDFVVDAGANIGAHTLYFAQKGCTVLAFEPQRMVHQLLCANMATNSIKTAYCFNSALADEPGVLFVPELDPYANINWGGLSIENHEGGYGVPVEVIDAYGVPSCRLIKIDVEGMEEKVLRGAAKTIEAHRPVLYVENDRKEKSESLVKYIEDLGYLIYEHLPPLYNPSNHAGNPVNVFGEIVSINLICVHEDDKETQDKVETFLGSQK